MNAVTPLLCLAGPAIALLASALRAVTEHDLRVEREREQYPLGARDARSARAGTAGVPVLGARRRRAVPEQRHAPTSALAG